MHEALFLVAEFCAQGGFQCFCIRNETRQERQRFFGKAFAVVVGGAVAVVAVGEPAFDFFHGHQAVGGGEAQQILDRCGVEFFAAVAIVLECALDELEGGILGKFVTLDDGIAEYFLVYAVRLGFPIKRKRGFERADAAFKEVGVE